jgi:Zn-dependent protease
VLEQFERPAPPVWRTAALHLGLFLLTLLTTTVAGAEWMTGGHLVDFLANGTPYLTGWQPTGPALVRALAYSLSFLGILTVHEFGHYFVARWHRVRTTLPYYLPFLTGVIDLGTFGAVIRIRDKIYSRREFFDIGIAGPLAGLLVAVGVLVYGFTHLPPLEYLYRIHPNYRFYGADYARYAYQGLQGELLVLNPPLLYRLLEHWLADPARLPHPYELTHYPYLVAGALGLFFTALNLLPIGQLDGGHILYGLLGARRYNRLVPVLFLAYLFYAGLGLFSFADDWQTWLYFGPVYALYLLTVLWRVRPKRRQVVQLAAGLWLAQLAVATALPGIMGNPGWLVFGLLLGRLTGIYHPAATDERALSPGRKALGWLTVGLFVLCFSPAPFDATAPAPSTPPRNAPRPAAYFVPMATPTATAPDRTAPEYRWSLAARIADQLLEAGLSHRDVSEATTPDDVIGRAALPKADAAYVRSLTVLPDGEARELFVRHARSKPNPDDPNCCDTFNFFRQLVWINLYSRPDEEDGLPA